MSAAAKLRLASVGKRFALKDGKEAVAVQDFSLDIRAGRVPRHRRAVGLRQDHGAQHARRVCELPTAGTLALDGRPIAGPGAERGVMFQDYALFPWRTVWGNVEFGLRLRSGRRRA